MPNRDQDQRRSQSQNEQNDLRSPSKRNERSDLNEKATDKNKRTQQAGSSSRDSSKDWDRDTDI